MNAKRSHLLALAAVFVAASPALADATPSTSRGFSAEKSFQIGDVDHVNVFNGNLLISLPIGATYPVSGHLSYHFGLSFNAKAWDFTQDTSYTEAIPQLNHSNAGFGWLLTLGRLESNNDPDVPLTQFVGPDGGEHAFYGKLHDSDTADADAYTRDGSYLRLSSLGGGYYQVEAPDGTKYAFYPNGELQTMSDRFGNSVSITGDDNPSNLLWTVSDTTGRTHKIYFVTDPYFGKRVDHVDFATFGAATTTWQFYYGQQTLDRPCPSNDPLVGPTVTVYMLTSVSEQSTGYGWGVGRYALSKTQPEIGCSGTGSVLSLTLPTGGSIGYTYQGYSFPYHSYSSRPRPERQTSNGIATRTLYDANGAQLGAWTYQTQTIGAPALEVVNTITTPLGHKTEHHFSVAIPLQTPNGWSIYEYGLPLSHSAADTTGTRFLSTREYDASNTLLRTTYVRYESDAPAGNNGTGSDVPSATKLNQRLASTRIVYEDDGGRYADTDYSSFDGLGHYRTTTLGGNFDAGNAHTSTADYNPGNGTFPGAFTMVPTSSPWIIDLYDRVDVTENGNTARRLFLFDTTTAFLNCVRTLSTGTINSGNDLLAVYTRGSDIAGHDGFTTQERYFGGDKHLIGTSGSCSDGASAEYTLSHTYQYGARKSTQYGGVSWKSLDLTIDQNTGLAAKSFDAAGLETDYTYDSLGRATQEVPVGLTGYGKDAWTKHEYAFQSLVGWTVTSRTCPSAAASCDATNDLTRASVALDGLGRTVKEQTLLPSGSLNERLTTYDGMGHKLTVSSWVADAAMTVPVTTYAGYDPFGRPSSVTSPDGKVTSFSRNGVRLVTSTQSIGLGLGGGEQSVSRRETYDRQGRLFHVDEYSDPSAPNTYVTTEYSYDEMGRLAKVCHNGTGNSCGQTRLFTYDNRGFLLSETHPEKGASGNGKLWNKVFDSRGHILQTRDGVDDSSRELNFFFDAAERLITVKDSSFPAVVLRQFTYDNAPGASAGKMATAMRRNDLAAPWSNNYQVTESYEYRERMGRTSKRTTQLAVGGTNQEQWVVGQSYDELGATSSINYPQCSAASCGDGSGTPARTVWFTRTHGGLTAVPGWANSIGYYPNLMVASVVHGNGTVDTIANDPNSIARPASITVAPGDGSPAWSTGTYAYDGVGNIKSIGADLFQYDKISRVVQGQLGSLGRTQSYTYDPYGNLTATTTDGTTVGSPASTSTNRLNGAASYDAGGNLTFWNMQTYGYDLFNMERDFNSGGEHWGYVYTAEDERLVALLDRPSNPLTNWTVRDLGGNVLTRDEHFPAGNGPPPIMPGPCPGPNGIFCDGFESGTWGAWSSSSASATRRVTDYVYRDGQLLASNALAGGGTQLSLDHLGTPRISTDSVLGGVGSRHTYFPFGQEATSLTQDAEAMKFTGHERDLQTTTSFDGDDYDYMHARFSKPQLGRFLSTDPLNGIPELPQSWNLYSYVIDSPLGFIDPDGTEWWDVFNNDSTQNMIELYSHADVAFLDQINVFANGPDLSGLPSGEQDVVRSAMEDSVPRDVFAAQALQDAYKLSEPPARWVGYELMAFQEAIDVIGEVDALEEVGVAVTARRYQHTGGGGVTVTRDGKRVFGIDWHTFELDGRNVTRPHFHVGKSNRLRNLHRPWQGGWWPW